MKSPIFIVLLFTWVPATAVDFNRDIRPILSNKCFACHGFDEHDRKADLRLDTREGAFEDLGGYAAIVPGDLDASEAWYRIVTDAEDELMPPPEFHKPLTEEEKSLIKHWIEEGAEYQVHWSYAPLLKAEGLSSSESIIDHYVSTRLDAAGLQLSEPADPITLSRRLHFDLTGLPAPPELIEDFAKAPSRQRYEELVDHLLASPAFGERLAVYWLDLVRYADTIGYHSDNMMEVSAYRDYVISAFNRNLPYDQFTIEQLAGDLLPEATLEQKIASGYNRLLQTTQEGGAQAAEYLAIHAADRVRNASTVWLGSTIGCAQCHDHKYDPFTAKDFYAFAAFFADVKEKPIGKREPNLKLPTQEDEAEKSRIEEAIRSHEIPEVLKNDKVLSESVEAAFSGWVAEAQKYFGQDVSQRWTIEKPAKWSATQGLKLELQKDNSLFAGKGKPSAPQYRIELSNEGTWNAILLETLTDESYSNGALAPGNGNFVVTGFEVYLNVERVAIERAAASFEQRGWALEGALDDDPKTGWAVGGHEEKPNDRQAWFAFAEPVELKRGDRLVVVMKHESGHNVHFPGRVRFGLTGNTEPDFEDSFRSLPGDLIAILEEGAKADPKQLDTLRNHFHEETPLLAGARKKKAELEKQLVAHENSIRTMLVSESLGEPRMTRLLHRGDWMDKDGEIIQPALPAFLPKDADLPSDRRGTRLDLADWIVAESNPLTARTFVNRVWMLLFGEGISRNVEDLGGQGEPPTHPELLDQLSIRFREGGWDVKNLVRELVLSDTYRQSSYVSPGLREKDPANELWSRQGRWRVEAEFVRDTALGLGGILAPEIGGVSVKPYQPAGYWQHLNFPRRTWEQGAGDELYRRGLYTFWCRSFLHPAMIAFDAPSREECTSQRTRSNIPQQALAMLNEPGFVEAARAFGERLVGSTESESDRIERGWKIATGRLPSTEEATVLLGVLNAQRAEYRANPAAAGEFLGIGERPAKADYDPVELAAWTQVARTILNAYETTARN